LSDVDFSLSLSSVCVAICVDLISGEMCGIIGWGFILFVWGLERVKVRSGSLLNSLFGQGCFFNVLGIAM
jgi:hypothetical protein